MTEMDEVGDKINKYECNLESMSMLRLANIFPSTLRRKGHKIPKYLVSSIRKRDWEVLGYIE